MPFKLVAYDKLKASIQLSIKSLIKDEGGDPAKIEESLPKLSTVRLVQYLFLKKTVEQLDGSDCDPKLKAAILNAAVYFKQQEIFATYKVLSASRSGFYTSLTSALNLTKDNEPARKELRVMYKKLEQFLSQQTYGISGDPENGPVEDSPYHTIAGYEVETDIGTLQDKLLAWNKEVMQEGRQNRAEKATKKPKKASASSAGTSPHSLFDSVGTSYAVAASSNTGAATVTLRTPKGAKNRTEEDEKENNSILVV